ncbi:MAG: DHH family phosphoesterase [Candidatus Paceibacterota bacterium]|jgi:nanoRNase/pAp phosphatase (c-di-AMP/oligoRNAs hydrolase)
MALSPKEQIIDQINKSETILICTSKNPNGDALGAALGFYLALKKLGKKTDIVSPTGIVSKYLFLPSANLITHKLEGAKDYVLSLDIDKEKLQQLRYEVSEKKLRIYITAKSGELKENNISIESARFKYDLIIVVGTGDLENLGTIYDDNSELFYEAPVVNIDHNPSNEYFGKINLVDVTVSSSSEIIFNLISSIDEKLFDENISTNLLAGIISETESFQNKNTTPKAFLAAASLVSFGANKQNITRFLYKTKSISLLKLMGKVMSNLKYNSQYKLGWSVINEEFASDDAQLENLRTAIKELGSSSPEFSLLFVLFKQNNAIKGIINFSEKAPIDSLARSFGGEVDNGQIVFASKEQLIENAEKETLKNIKDWADGLKG